MHYLHMLVFFILFFSSDLYGQEEIIENISVVDSSTYNGKKIFVFNDGSWEYESEFKVVETVRANLVSGVVSFSLEDLYSQNWKNHKTHLIDYNLRALVDTVFFNVSGAIPPVKASCNSGFKIRWGRWHLGNDFAAAVGTEVHSVWDGKVRYAQMNGGGYGNLVIVRHANGIETYYAHLSKINVQVNQIIKANDLIGLVGNTGHSTGAHLHFEVRIFGNPINPSEIFEKEKLCITAESFPSMPAVSKNIFAKEIFNISNESILGVGIVRSRRGRKTASNLGEN